MRTRGRRQDLRAEDNNAIAGGEANNRVSRTAATGTTTMTTTSSSPPSVSSSPAPASTSPTVVKIKKVEKSPTYSRATAPKSASSSLAKYTKSAPSPSPSPRSPSKLPGPFQFPLIVILNLALSALGSGIAYPYTKGLVAAHERPLETWEEASIVVGWRIVELALGWFGNYDSYDLTAMNILSHGPPLYLLYAFYEVPAQALLLSLAIETVATYLPFRLLRPLSSAHAEPSRAPNAEIVSDRPIALLTTLLAGAIYSVTLFLAYLFYLPEQMAAHFRGLPTLAPAHGRSLAMLAATLLPATLPLGFAARAFVFTPAGATRQDAARRRAVEEFDPATASLAETVRWNLWWGWADQTRAVVRRTILLTIVTGANAFLHAHLSVRGVEAPGAVAWAAVWVVAAAFTGLGLGIVGSV